MFQGRFLNVLKKFRVCFKEVSRAFQGSFLGVSRMFQENLKGVSIKFNGSFKRVSKEFPVDSVMSLSREIYGPFKEGSNVFQRS